MGSNQPLFVGINFEPIQFPANVVIKLIPRSATVCHPFTVSPLITVSSVSTPVWTAAPNPAAKANEAPPVNGDKHNANAFTPEPRAAPATPRHKSLPVSPASALEANWAPPISIAAPTIPIIAQIPKWPVGSYLLTGSFPQYAYKFNPLILSGSRYSIESGEIHLHNSGE